MKKSFVNQALAPWLYLKNRTGTPCPRSLNYFRIYFLFAYYLGIAPFYFGYNRESDTYIAKFSKVQKVICIIMQAFCVYQFSNLFRGIDFHNLYKDPNNIFELANVIGFSAYLLVQYSTVWLRKDNFSKIFEMVQNSPLGSSERENQSSIYSSIFIALVFIGWSLYNTLSQNVAIHKWELLQVPANFTSRAMFVYLFESNWSSGIKNYNWTLLACLGILYSFIELYQWLCTHFTDWLLLTSALFLRQIAQEFSVALKQNAIKGMEHYIWIKLVVKEINNAIGLVTLCVVVTALPYYSSNAETVLETKEFFRKFRISFFCGVFFISLGIAADANMKINEIKDWLMVETNGNNTPQSTLIVVVNEVGQIGLKGSSFFTVTFGFLGTIVSLVLTYAIIIVQFQLGSNKAPVTNAMAKP